MRLFAGMAGIAMTGTPKGTMPGYPWTGMVMGMDGMGYRGNGTLVGICICGASHGMAGNIGNLGMAGMTGACMATGRRHPCCIKVMVAGANEGAGTTGICPIPSGLNIAGWGNGNKFAGNTGYAVCMGVDACTG
ncbi:MAG: hypothetical protein HXY27_04305 [Hydrogenophilaceae bacterium]|nr:hypothetical protein [Hydrogenophilaceae bacterium]